MSKLPFSFVAIPEYFYTSGWICMKDSEKFMKRMKFLHWAFKKCSPFPKKIRFDGKIISLEPFEFIAGRKSSAIECGLTEGEFRNQLNNHSNAGWITSRTTSHYSIHTWVTTAFTEKNNQPNNQPNNHNIRMEDDISKNIDLSSSSKKENEKEKSDQKIISLSFSDIKEKEIFEGISIYASSLGFALQENVLIRWIENFDEEFIKQALAQLIKKNSKKSFEGNHEAYLETIIQEKHNFKMNLDLANRVKENAHWEELVITKQYCYIELGNEFMFKWPHEQFKECLKEKFNRMRG